MMQEWICLKCKQVFSAGESYAKCCGKVEVFNPQKHTQLIVGMANCWNSIDKKIDSEWINHPIYRKVWEEHIRNGSYGADRIFMDFVDELIDRIK